MVDSTKKRSDEEDLESDVLTDLLAADDDADTDDDETEDIDTGADEDEEDF